MAIELEVRSNSKKAQSDLNKLRATALSIRDSLIGSKPVNLKVNSKDIDSAGTKLTKLRQAGKDIKVNVKTNVSKDLENSLAKLKSQTNNLKETKLSLNTKDAQKSADSLSNSLSSLVKSLAIAGAAFAGFTGIIRLSDSITNLDTRLRIAATSNEDFQTSLLAVKNIAVSTRTPIAAVAELYQKLSMSSQRLGATQRQVAIATQNVSKIMTASGAGAQQSQAAIIQLGQALSSGVLQGDELRSIAENAPMLLDVIAKGMGVSREQIKLLGAEGKLTSKEVFGALVLGTEDANKAFSKTGVTFAQAFTNIGNAAFLTMRAFSDIAGDIGVADWLNKQAISLARFAESLDEKFLILKVSLLVFRHSVISAFTAVPKAIEVAIGKAIDAVKGITLTPIKAMDIFPDLNASLAYVNMWASKVEHAFFWVYDRVIGHSWIPDLVNGVIEWIGKLTGTPTKVVENFTNFVDNAFKKLTDIKDTLFNFDNASAGFGKLVKYMDNAINTLKGKSNDIFGSSFSVGKQANTSELNAKDLALPVMGTVGAIGFSSLVSSLTGIKGIIPAMGLLVATLTKPLSMGIVSISTAVYGLLTLLVMKAIGNPFKTGLLTLAGAVALNSKELYKTTTGQTGTFYKDLKNYFDHSQLGHTLKQLLGVQDKIAYTFKDLNAPGGIGKSSTTAYVGAGYQRERKNRTIGSDVVNALPVQLQIPALATATGLAVGLALKTFGFGQLGVLVAGITALTSAKLTLKIVDPAEVTRFTGALTLGVFNIISKGITFFFGEVFGPKGFGGVFKEGGLLAVASSLKETLIAIGGMMLLFKSGRSAIGSMAAKTVVAPTNIGRNIADRFDLKQMELRTALTEKLTLANVKDAEEKLRIRKLETEAARNAITNTNRTATAFNILNSAVLRETQATNALAIAQSKAVIAQEKVAMMTKASNAMKERLATGTEELKRSTVANVAGVGGIFGGLAGFQMGTEIAKGMTGSSEWMKVGTTMAVALVGQVIGSALFGSITAVLVRGIPLAFASVFTTIPGLIIGAFAAGYILWKNPEIWSAMGKVLDDFINKLRTLLDSWAPRINKAVGFNIIDTKEVDALKAKLSENTKALNENTKAYANPKSAKDFELAKAKKIRLEAERANLSDEQRKAGFGSAGNPNVSYDPFLAGQAKKIQESVTTKERQENLESLKRVKDFFGAINEELSKTPFEFLNQFKTFRAIDAQLSKTPLDILSKLNPISSANASETSNAQMRANNITNLKDAKTGDFRVFETKEDALKASMKQIELYMTGKSKAAGNDPKVTVKEIIDLWRPPSEQRGKGDITQEKYYEAVSKSIGQEVNTTLAPTENTLRALAVAIANVETGGKGRETVKDTADTKPTGWFEKATSEVKSFALSLGFAEKTVDGWLSVFKATPPNFADKFAEAVDIDAQVALVNSALNSLKQTPILVEDFVKLSTAEQEDLVKNITSGLEAAKIPASAGALIKKKAEEAYKTLQDALDTIRTAKVPALKERLSTLPVNLATAPVYGQMIGDKLQEAGKPYLDRPITSLEEAKGIADAITEYIDAKAAYLKTPNISTSLAMQEKETALDAKTNPKVNTTLKTSVYFAKDNAQKSVDDINEKLKDFSKLKLTAKSLKAMTPEFADRLDELMTSYSSAVDALSNNVEDPALKMAAEELRAKIISEYENFHRLTIDNITGDIKSIPSSLAITAAQNYVTQMMSNITTGIIDVLEGTKKPKEFFKDLALFTTKSIMDNFVKGFTEGIFGKDGSFFTAFAQTFVGGQIDIGNKVGTWMRELFSGSATTKDTASIDTPLLGGVGGNEGDNPVVSATEIASDATVIATEQQTMGLLSGLQELGSGFMKGLSSLGGLFQNAFSGLTSLFSGGGSGGGLLGGLLGGIGGMFSGGGFETFSNFLQFGPMFANGGPVYGAGTGVSDSIPAMLSNGEFVINAQATRRNRALLEMINNNTMPHFAEGGFVNTQAYSTLDKSLSNSNSNAQSTSVFNINITGDVSQQTRMEIQKMLPQIASGVNMHNKENGLRR
jgi:tape measure domain-containing protein